MFNRVPNKTLLKSIARINFEHECANIVGVLGKKYEYVFFVSRYTFSLDVLVRNLLRHYEEVWNKNLIWSIYLLYFYFDQTFWNARGGMV